jgi:hypothetical protein
LKKKDFAISTFAIIAKYLLDGFLYLQYNVGEAAKQEQVLVWQSNRNRLWKSPATSSHLGSDNKLICCSAGVSFITANPIYVAKFSTPVLQLEKFQGDKLHTEIENI